MSNLKTCICGCGEHVTSKVNFRPGHDARFVSQLVRQAREGEITKRKAIAEAKKVSPSLAAKVARYLAAKAIKDHNR